MAEQLMNVVSHFNFLTPNVYLCCVVVLKVKNYLKAIEATDNTC